MNNRLYLEGLEVDLTDVINIPLNKTFEDLANPTNINNEFSKTIKLPVSAQNNKVLGNAFRLDKMVLEKAGAKNIGQFLNPTRKIPFKLLNNNDLIMEGYAKLSLVDNSSDNKFYTLNLFGTLGDLFHKLLNVAVTEKFCPQLDVSEIFDNEGNLYPYAIAFNPLNETRELNPDLENPGGYIWRDNRYLLKDFLSGNQELSADSIKKCWEANPDTRASHNIDWCKENEQDWQIVGFAPTHHGFPNDFDPLAYEHKPSNSDTDIDIEPTKTLLFTDTATENSTYNSEALIGDGLTEEQYQQFVSWQQKPYIYIRRLFEMFQKSMQEHSDLFDGYTLDIDKNWSIAEDDKILNPYWGNLCYTMDFLFNQDVVITNETHNLIPYDEAPYNGIDYIHPQEKNGINRIGLRKSYKISYDDEDIINNISIDDYVCLALPIMSSPNINEDWNASFIDGKVVVARNTTHPGTVIGSLTTVCPQLFFSHYMMNKFNYEAIPVKFANGGYRVTVNVYDERNNVIHTKINTWRATHTNNYKNYETKILNDTDKVNGEIIDILNETDRDKAAVLMHRIFSGNEVENGLLVNSDDIKYLAIGFPLRSFGLIPIGVKKPRIEVVVDMLAEDYTNIYSPYRGAIGAYSYWSAGLAGNEYAVGTCDISNKDIWVTKENWENQVANSNYITLFDVPYNDNQIMMRFTDTYEENPVDINSRLLRDFLSTDSNDEGDYIVKGGKTHINGYGRYYSLVGRTNDEDIPSYSRLFNNTEEEQNINNELIPLGLSHPEIKISAQFIDNHHNPIIKLENLWVKETPLFDVLLEYSKIFGLFWNVNNSTKKIELLTRFTYFKDYTIEDWTNKIDYSKDFQVTPILHSSKYLNFDYVDEKDAFNYSTYGENHLVNYGGYRLKTGYEFTPDSEDLFKDIHSTCISNRNLLTWNQIYNYNPKKLPYVTTSPFTMMDCDSKDHKSQIEINNWIFRNDSETVFSKADIESDNWFNEHIFQIIEDTPTMIATQKYMYIDAARDDEDYFINNGYVINCDTFPNFSLISNEKGCLFARPTEHYASGIVNSNGVRLTDSKTASAEYEWIYDYAWRKWMDERYNINNKKITCYVNLNPMDFCNITPKGKTNDIYFANFKTINNQLYMLNKIYDYNPQSPESTKCDFIQISDIDAYKDERLVKYKLFSLEDNSTTGGIPLTQVELIDGVYRIDTIDLKDSGYMLDYRHATPEALYKLYNENEEGDLSLKFKITKSPIADITLQTFGNDSFLTMFIDKIEDEETGEVTYKSSRSASIKENDDNWYDDRCYDKQFYLLPYYKWLASDDGTFNEQSLSFNAIDTSNTIKSINYTIKDIAAQFKGDLSFRTASTSDFALGSVIVPVYNNGYFGVPGSYYVTQPNCYFTMTNNIGLTLSDAKLISFYEFVFECKKEAQDQLIEEGIEKVIVPTSNNVVKCSTLPSVHNNFEEQDCVLVNGNKMYDSVLDNNPVVEEIKDWLKNNKGYTSVDYARNAAGKIEPPLLVTIVLYSLNGLDNNKISITDNKSKSSEFYVFDGVNDMPLIYAGIDSNTNNYYNTNWEEVSDRIRTNIFALYGGTGYYNKSKNTEELVKISNTSNRYSDVKIQYRGLLSADNFYNVPNSTLTVDKLQLNNCRFDDYIQKVDYDKIPLFIDQDVDGRDGYVYQTFRQKLLGDIASVELDVRGIPTAPVKPDGDNITTTVTATLGLTTIDPSEIEISYTSYRIDEENGVIVWIEESYDNDITNLTLDGFNVSNNDMPYQRGFKIRYHIKNSMIYREYSFVQDFTLISD